MAGERQLEQQQQQQQTARRDERSGCIELGTQHHQRLTAPSFVYLQHLSSSWLYTRMAQSCLSAYRKHQTYHMEHTRSMLGRDNEQRQAMIEAARAKCETCNSQAVESSCKVV